MRYSQSLGNTIFAEDYFRERLHAFIDNLNTLYVAFTRSKEELIVFAPRPKKIKEETGEVEKISSVADALWGALHWKVTDTKQGESLMPLSPSFDTKAGLFELGSWWHPSVAKADESSPEEVEMIRINSISPDDRLQLRLHGKGFFFDNEKRKHGALMHEVLSQIRTRADIGSAVESYRLAGVINKSEAETLILRLEELLKTVEVLPWYDGTARVLNEVDILFGKGLSKRPDRVMITDDKVVVVDYKFGDIQDKRHHNQVKNYMKLIRQMGYTKVEGFLWYVEQGKIDVVDS